MQLSNSNIKIYTDGACSGNPGKGAFAFIILNDNNDVICKFTKGFNLTTNNRMELMAVIESLKYLKKNSIFNNIEIYSDSKYVVDAINKNWLNNWILKNFKNVKNIDLWRNYIDISSNFNIKFYWVEGHSINRFNNECDKLARNFIKNGELENDENFI